MIGSESLRGDIFCKLLLRLLITLEFQTGKDETKENKLY